jgi:hypothetical protein
LIGKDDVHQADVDQVDVVRKAGERLKPLPTQETVDPALKWKVKF